MLRSNLKKTSSLLLIGTLSLLTLGTVSAETTGLTAGSLDSSDMVAVSFWLATAVMLASTVFFILERQNVAPKWKTSMTVASLVTGVAWYHYTYMREHWANNGESPLVLRYIDWLITVPLQVSEFYLILAAIGAASAMLFWRLFGASIVMLVAGFLAESGEMPSNLTWPLFVVGMLAWLYIIYEIWAGEAKEKVSQASEGTQFAFKSMALILTVGWAIYPIGFVMGNGASDSAVNNLNILYNIADVVNKTAFGMMVWYAATMDSKSNASEE
ncbi:MAG: bacteriorhodopsin-like [Candidatus Poseidoniales archaeon]